MYSILGYCSLILALLAHPEKSEELKIDGVRCYMGGGQVILGRAPHCQAEK